MPMFEHLLKFRYITVVMVILSLLHAVGYLVMGTRIAFHAYAHVLDEPGPMSENRPGLELLHSLDFLFVSLVLLVLGLGIAKLFLLPPDSKQLSSLPGWLRIESIAELKVLLWETILTTLLIAGLSQLIAGIFTKLDWTILLTPIAILILSLSLFFMKKA
jgi:uncharacterized membrane protein YqhA